MTNKAARWLIASLCLVLGACATNVSPDTYSVGSVGQVNRSVRAKIVNARAVDLQGTQGLGATAGAVAGGVAGSAAGSGRGSALGAIGGAVVGGIGGAMLEQHATARQGMEYVVQTSNGNLMTIVQGSEPKLHEGQNVFVLYGSPARIILDSHSQ